MEQHIICYFYVLKNFVCNNNDLLTVAVLAAGSIISLYMNLPN